ncbi:hypothetical protein ACAG26_24280 [Mycobacterium sp. pUA109]|uniref:hypothetical protein n=1 Tax=Mycobacterium sp. pUA109 TaxID=3238982 RepID=UPI00351B26E5
MAKSAQPEKPFALINDRETLKLLVDNIHNLEYPLVGTTQWIKLPYFQDRLSGNAAGVNEVKRRFCEAIVLLLEKNGRLKTESPLRRKRRRADD